jgi:predicted HicB family RNase H-like nuclease
MSDETVFSDQGDNLSAAMERVVESMSMGRKAKTNAPEGETASRQVILRATENDHDRWKQAAASQGISMSEFIRNVCNEAATEILDCKHPMEFRKIYPWSDVCLKCGLRLK